MLSTVQICRRSQVSFGPISWLIVGEVFPLAVRSPATALATLTNFGSNFLVSLREKTLHANSSYSHYAPSLGFKPQLRLSMPHLFFPSVSSTLVPKDYAGCIPILEQDIYIAPSNNNHGSASFP